MANQNVVGWFEIPVYNMDRAIKFYEKVFKCRLTRNQFGPLDMALFPNIKEGNGASGALVFNKEHYKPSRDGVLIYFTTPSGDINKDLKIVNETGGEVIQTKWLISESIGYLGVFLDTEGNRIALHSIS